jgi:hypothetical protein
LFDQLYKYRYYFLLLVIPLLIFLFPFVDKAVQVDNSLSVWFKEKDPVLQTYEQFRQSFGSDQLITIVYKAGEESFSDALKKVDRLSGQLDSLTNTQSVSSLTSVQIPERTGMIVKQSGIVDLSYSDAFNRSRIRKYNHLSQYYYKSDNEAYRIIIQLKDLPDFAEQQGKIIDTIKQVTHEVLPSEQVAFGGVGVIFEELNRFSQKQFGIFLGLCYLFIIIAILWRYKSWKVLTYALLVIICSTVITLGCYGLAGHRMNLMTTFLPTIIVLLGLLDVIHAVNQHQKVKDSDPLKSLRKVWKPCLYTSLTTMAGFLALCFTPISVLRDFGAYSALGIALCFLFTLYFGLFFLPWMGKDPGRESWAYSLIAYSQRKARLLRVSVLFVLVICLIGLFRLEIDTYTLGYFPEEHEVAQDHKKIEAWWGHYMPLEFIVVPQSKEDLFSGRLLHKLDTFSSQVMDDQDISSAFGYPTLIAMGMQLRYGERAKQLYGSQRAVDNIAASLKKERPDLYELYIGENEESGRLTFFGRMATAGTLKDKLAELEQLSDSIFTQTTEVKAAGYLPMYAEIINYISYSQLISLMAAIVLIFVLVYLYLKDWRLAFIAICTNIFPLILMFGVVGLAGIDIDIATASIAAIALSFCIDDSIHVLYHFLNERKKSEYSIALQKTFDNVGTAVLTSSLLLFFGYALMVFSSLKTAQLFGGLTAIMVLGALVSQFIIFPLLLQWLTKVKC